VSNGFVRNPSLSSLRDGFLFLQIFLFASAAPLLLRVKLPTLLPFLAPRKPRRVPDTEQIEKIVQYVDTLLSAGRRFPRPGCLTRGLTLYYFLKRAGLDVQIFFGMGSMNGAFSGHCWLTKDGEPFLEKQDPRPFFTPMYRFPASDIIHPSR
jgi:Transglutaminase-like superfamily